jgi:hypothetical protein
VTMDAALTRSHQENIVTTRTAEDVDRASTWAGAIVVAKAACWPPTRPGFLADLQAGGVRPHVAPG